MIEWDVVQANLWIDLQRTLNNYLFAALQVVAWYSNMTEHYTLHPQGT